MSVINTNITSMIGQSNLSKSQNALQTSMERLSSGLRINSAKDDAAGQAQNGTNSSDEIGQRLEEIDRISAETSFNGVKVLSENEGLKIQVGANDGETITVNLEKINSSSLGLTNFSVNEVKLGDEITMNTAATPGAITTTGGTLHEVLNDDGTGTGDYVIKDANGNLFKAAESNTAGASATPFNLNSSTTAVIATAPNDLQVRYANNGDDTGDALTEYDGEMTSTTPLADLDAALNQIDSLRSELGAVQNRFEDPAAGGYFCIGTGQPDPAERSFSAGLR